MELLPEHLLLVRARRAYEWGRLRRALLGALPLALLIGPALALTPRVVPTVILGAMLLLGAIGLLWFGHGLPRAALLGVAAGALPLGLVLCSARLGHACAGSMCMQFCFGTSALGGAAAGALIGSWAFEKRVSEANGTNANLPLQTRDDPAQRERHSMELLRDAPMDMGLGIKREAPRHY